MFDPLVASPASAGLAGATDETAGAPAPAATAGKPDITPAAARNIARLAGKKGGKTSKRHVALLPLDVALPEDFSLATSAARLRVIEALAVAIAKGKVSALGATTMLAAIKEARAEANDDAAQRVAELEARVEALVAAGTIRL